MAWSVMVLNDIGTRSCEVKSHIENNLDELTDCWRSVAVNSILVSSTFVRHECSRSAMAISVSLMESSSGREGRFGLTL